MYFSRLLKTFNLHLHFIKQLFIIFMQTGTVKFFNNSKGFGFIKDNDSNEEIFVHISGLVDEVREDDEVTFETTQGKKGLNAVNVRLS